MKKVAIVTIDSFNYGNRLQNYVLQQVLCKAGCSVKTLHRKDVHIGLKSFIKIIMQDIMQTKVAKFRQFDRNIFFWFNNWQIFQLHCTDGKKYCKIKKKNVHNMLK